MSHRAKHLHRNWIAERLAKAVERRAKHTDNPRRPRPPHIVLPVVRFLGRH
jgi:hypothetical protein